MKGLSAEIFRLSAEFLAPPTLKNNREPWSEPINFTQSVRNRDVHGGAVATAVAVPAR